MIYRVIDANLNRVVEGLRVIEEIFRYANNSDAMVAIRDLRHRFSGFASDLREKYPLISKRDINSDEGRFNNHSVYSDVNQLLTANLQRVEEGLRVIEEFLRLIPDIDSSDVCQQIRFSVYDLEARFSVHLPQRRKLVNFSSGRTKLYLIYDLDILQSKGISKLDDVLELGYRLLDAGVDILQVRFSDKFCDRFVLDLVKGFVNKVKGEDKLIFVNNRPDIVFLSGANLHIGQDDIPAVDARDIVGDNALIGLSCHNDEQILMAQELPIDYFTIGPVFPTKTKPEYSAVGIELVEKWHKLDKPFVVIGGITLDNINELLKYSPFAICVCRDILERNNLEQRVREYVEKLKVSEKV